MYSSIKQSERENNDKVIILGLRKRSKGSQKQSRLQSAVNHNPKIQGANVGLSKNHAALLNAAISYDYRTERCETVS